MKIFSYNSTFSLFLLSTVFLFYPLMSEMPTASESDTTATPAEAVPTTPPPPPAPDAMPTAQPAAPTEATAPAAPTEETATPLTAPAPEVKPEQLKWPETIEIDEGKESTAKTSNPDIMKLFKKVNAALDKMSSVIDQMLKARTDLYQKFFEQDAKLDDFFQQTQFSTGAIQETIQQTSETKQPQTPSEQTTPTTAATAGQEAHQKDLTTINTQITALSQDKDALKKLLTQMDSDIEKIKSITLQARKKSLDILAQESQATAQQIADLVDKNLKEVTGLQQNFENATAKTFQASTDKIQESIKAIQDNIAKLQAKGVALEAEKTVITTEAKPTAPKKVMFKSWLITEKKPVTKEEKEAETLVYYIFNRMADGITWIMQFVYSTYLQIKGKLFGPTEIPQQTIQPTAPTPKAPTTTAPTTATPTAEAPKIEPPSTIQTATTTPEASATPDTTITPETTATTDAPNPEMPTAPTMPTT